MGRISEAKDDAKLDLAVKFLQEIAGEHNQLVVAAVEGLIEGQRAKPRVPAADTRPLFARLSESANPLVKERGQELGTLWGNAASMQATLVAINDSSLPAEQ